MRNLRYLLIMVIPLYACYLATTSSEIIAGRIIVKIGDETVNYLTSVEGIGSIIEVVEASTPGDEGIIITFDLPGRSDYSNLKLRRIVTRGNNDWWDWHRGFLRGNVERRVVEVSVYTDDGDEILLVKCFDAWPCQWRILDIDPRQKGKIFEEIEINFWRIEYRGLGT